MFEEEKETAVAVEDSDFADEAKPAPAQEEAEKVEEAVEETEKVELYAENAEEEAKPEEPAPQPDEIQYDDENLEKIENARQDFYKVYSKNNMVKWIVTAVSILIIICGWLIPNAIEAIKNYSMFIAIACCAVGLIGLLVYNSFYKRIVQRAMHHYFHEHYDHTNAYVFPEEVTNLQGSVDNKLDPEEFKECDIYKDVTKVGSRACYTFNYEGKVIKLADTAAQVIGGRMMQTVFVGKYLFTTNNYEGSDILIYFKGNKRALPPTNLAGRKVLSDSKNIVIYGDKDAEKIVTEKFREALGQFQTNKTFVDMAIAIRAGKTYFAMGYEDDLMVISLERKFNPGPTKQFRGDLLKVLELIKLLK